MASSLPSTGEDGSLNRSRANLGINEEISEDEARRRREQLNRRPSYRMILKDLETCQSADQGAKQLKREMLEQRPTSTEAGMLGDGTGKPPTPYDSGGGLSNGGGSGGFGGGSGMGAPSSLILRNMATSQPPALTAANLLQVSTAAAAAVAQRTLNMMPPLPRLLAGNNTAVTSPSINNSSSEIPSQPQPQLMNSLAAANTTNPMLSAVAAAAAANNLIHLPSSNDFINIATKPGDMVGAAQQQQLQFPPHNNVDWSTNLLSTYQNSTSGANSFAAGSGIIGTGGVSPLGLGARQGSASLTSLSDNDNNDSNRKRQVRLLKNREAAKECRRKKKEYVKCLENRVAVLENQNKALIEELKTLKELYCRKEKSELA